MSQNLQTMMDTAVSFFLGGERCSVVLDLQPNSRNIGGMNEAVPKYPRHSLGAATATNYALAVEIGLKCLKRVREPTSNLAGHDIHKLFSALDDETRNSVWNNFSNRHKDLNGLRSQ